MRSIACTASVTRNEQRYAMPPGGLFVYTPSTSANAFFRSYEPVQIEKRPAGNFDGLAAASVYPWSATVLILSAVIVPSFFAASSALM